MIANPPKGHLLVRAATADELEESVASLWEIVNCTGGWVGSFDEEDHLDDLEVRLITIRASETELEAIWEQVRRGLPARVAWEQVRGASWQSTQQLRALMSGTGHAGTDGDKRDIEFIFEELHAANPEIRVRHLPYTPFSSGEDRLWFLDEQRGVAEVELSSRDGNCPFQVASTALNHCVTIYSVKDAVATVARWLSPETCQDDLSDADPE